ncbi:MAG: hypothetical protein JWO15_3546 [Sphingomonadales bacterium]|nr:hypothetical protein [Sphingomonadales bacterium]
MKCPIHKNHEMTALFTSCYCSKCEDDSITETLYWWDLPYSMGMKITDEMMTSFLRVSFPGATDFDYWEELSQTATSVWELRARITLGGIDYYDKYELEFSRVVRDDAYHERSKYEFIQKMKAANPPS